jgi:hypothetical protein
LRNVTFHGPGHRLLAFGRELLRGDPVEMSNEHAESLAANPHVRVTVTEAATEPEADTGEGRPTDDEKET